MKELFTVDYSAKSVSVNYSSMEDRIQWISRCDGDIFIRAWITRRFLGMIMPRIAEWMMKRNVQTECASVLPVDSAGKMAMGLYEHEIAQQQVQAIRENIPVMKIVDEFIVDNFTMSMTAKGYVNIALAAPKDRINLKFQASMPQVHKIMGELMEISSVSGWGIPDPWKALKREGGFVSAMIIN